MKIRNAALAGQPVGVGDRYADADAAGVFEVTPTEGARLLGIPGFSVVVDRAGPKREPRVAPETPVDQVNEAPPGPTTDPVAVETDAPPADPVDADETIEETEESGDPSGS